MVTSKRNAVLSHAHVTNDWCNILSAKNFSVGNDLEVAAFGTASSELEGSLEHTRIYYHLSLKIFLSGSAMHVDT